MSIRSATSALMPLDEALTRLLVVEPVKVFVVSVAEGIGSVLAADVVAPTDLPVNPRAMRDGWGVAGSDVTGASAYAPVTPLPPPPWLDQGDAMPPGIDTILPPDALDGDGDIVAEVAPGGGVAGIGQEIAQGDVLARSGERLTPIGALAIGASGIDTVAVRVPHVRILDIGGNSASTIAGLAAATGVEVTSSPCSRERESIADALLVPGADAVFVVGGTGFGRTDHSAEALAGRGRLDAHGIALRPGDSAGFGWVGSVPVLLLPGRPEAALATYLTLGRPLLARLCGMNLSGKASGHLSRKVSSTIGMSDIVFVRMTNERVEPIGGADLPLRRLIHAWGAVLVPPEREGYPEGEWIEVMPL